MPIKYEGRLPELKVEGNDLDEIFDIQHLEYEKQKAKRSSLIKEINNYKPELINRVRDPEDKRSFLYKID